MEIMSKRNNTDDNVVTNVKKKQKTKQPTVEELNELNETQILYNNSLFRKQIEELLLNSKIKKKHQVKLTEWVEKFKNILDCLPSHGPINISTFSKTPEKRPSKDDRFINHMVVHCRNNLCCDKDIDITFKAPTFMNSFGLHKLDCLPGPNLIMNISVTIPKSCFLERDFLNNRYEVKKFFYLMYLAEHLKSSEICSNIKCSYYQDNILIPFLEITPINSDKTFVNVFAVPESTSIKIVRGLPNVNNVRAQVFSNLLIKDTNYLDKLPTFFYNAALGFDLTLEENNAFIQLTLNDLKNVQDGIKLILIWMNKRKINEGLGSFSNDIMIYIMVYMVLKRKIDNHMSSYQVFRNFLNFMKTTDLREESISICDNTTEELMAQFKNAFDIVILDKTGHFNVASFLNVNMYLKMKQECDLAFENLDGDAPISFSNLFLIDAPFFLHYDGIISLKSNDNFQSVLKDTNDYEKAAFQGHHMFLVLKILQNIFKRGLNKRVRYIVPLVERLEKWEYGVRYKTTFKKILFGIVLNQDYAFQQLEYGPNLDDPKIEEFNGFWGELAENRRFTDGSAKAVIHFSTKTIKDRREIMKSIVDFLMKNKVQLEYKFYYNQFEEVLVSNAINSWYSIGTNEETTALIIKSSDELGRKIRMLDIQLPITGIGMISTVFCYTNVFPQIPTYHHKGKSLTNLKGKSMILKEKLNAVPKYVEPIECVLQLEHSSKWPTDFDALQQMKVMFYLELSKLLEKKFKIISSVKEKYIDIFYDGIVFRYTIYISKEVALMKKNVKENGLITYRNTEVSLEVEKKFDVLPKIIGALGGIHGQFPSFGISSCLAKRWIRSHLIDEYLFPEIVIDLLNASQFLKQSSFTNAVSPQIAFLRFLKLIVEMQWDLAPVVLNFNNELKSEQITKVTSEMMSANNNLPPLYIITPYDNGDSIFTKKAPSKRVLIRLKILAAEVLKTVESSLVKELLLDEKELFVPNIEGFDCVINMKFLINPKRHENILKSDLNGKISFEKPSREDQLMPVLNFNPIEIYLQELRDNYGKFCTFFYDNYGGNFIGVLWNPEEFLPKNLKVSYILGRTIENDKLIPDKKEIIRGFKIMGEGLVKSIDIKS